MAPRNTLGRAPAKPGKFPALIEGPGGQALCTDGVGSAARPGHAVGLERGRHQRQCASSRSRAGSTPAATRIAAAEITLRSRGR